MVTITTTTATTTTTITHSASKSNLFPTVPVSLLKQTKTNHNFYFLSPSTFDDHLQIITTTTTTTTMSSSSPQSPQSPSSPPPPFEQLSAESRSLFSDHYHLGRLFLGLRSAAWSDLHLDAQGRVDFFREREEWNHWRLAVASFSSAAKVKVIDALGPSAGFHLELGGAAVGATTRRKGRLVADEEAMASPVLRLATSGGGWYRLDGRYEGAKRRVAFSAVLAKRNLFQTGDRILLGTSVEGFDDLFGRRVSKYRWTAKWTSPPSSPASMKDGSSLTSWIATLKDASTNTGYGYIFPSKVQLTIGAYAEEKWPESPKTVKCRPVGGGRQWPWSKWTYLKRYQQLSSSGWELKLGNFSGLVLSYGGSLLTWEQGEGRQLKVKVNSNGELAAAIVHYRTDLAAPFALTTIFSLSGMVDVWRRRASIGFGLEFTG